MILTEGTTLFLEWVNTGNVDSTVNVYLVGGGEEQLLTPSPIFNSRHFDWTVGEQAEFTDDTEYRLAVVGALIDEGGTQRGESQEFRIGVGECAGELVLNCPQAEGRDNPEPYTCTGTISDGSPIDFQYGLNKNCLWLIRAPVGYSVSLSFDWFSTELQYDYVEIFSGDEVDLSTRLTRLTGTMDDINNDPNQCGEGSNTWCSESNEMLVRFYSDVIIAEFGFQANFEVVEIGSITIQGNKAVIPITTVLSDQDQPPHSYE